MNGYRDQVEREVADGDVYGVERAEREEGDLLPELQGARLQEIALPEGYPGAEEGAQRVYAGQGPREWKTDEGELVVEGQGEVEEEVEGSEGAGKTEGTERPSVTFFTCKLETVRSMSSTMWGRLTASRRMSRRSWPELRMWPQSRWSCCPAREPRQRRRPYCCLHLQISTAMTFEGRTKRRAGKGCC